MTLSVHRYYEVELSKAQRLLAIAQYLLDENKNASEDVRVAWGQLNVDTEAHIQNLQYHKKLVEEYNELLASYEELEELKRQQSRYRVLITDALEKQKDFSAEETKLLEFTRKIQQINEKIQAQPLSQVYTELSSIQELKIELDRRLKSFKGKRVELENRAFHSTELNVLDELSETAYAASHIDFTPEEIPEIELSNVANKDTFNLPTGMHPRAKRRELLRRYADYADDVDQQAVYHEFAPRVRQDALDKYVPESGKLPLKEIYELFRAHDPNKPQIFPLQIDEQADAIDATDNALFPDNTVIPEFNQGLNGDCWFIAALRALIEQKSGIQLLAFSMRDLTGLDAFTGQGNSLDGKVLVRVMLPVKGEVVTPTYLLLDKKYFNTSRTVFSNQLVIKLAEQVMAHIHGTGRFDDLDGGHGKEVFHQWFGQERENIDDNYHDQINYRDYLCRKIWRANQNDEHYKKVLNALFGDNEQFKSDFNSLRSALEEYFPKIDDGDEISYESLRQFKIDALKQISDRPYNFQNKKRNARDNLDEILYRLTRPLRKHAGPENNVYQLSDYQIEIFDKIEKAHQQHKVILASTFKNLGKADGNGYSAGENLSRGMAGGHAYAVLGTRVVTTEGKTLRYVRVANPWGHLQVRHEKFEQARIGANFYISRDENGDTHFLREGTIIPEFDIPMKEFTKLFDGVDILDSPEALLRNIVDDVNQSFLLRKLPQVQSSASAYIDPRRVDSSSIGMSEEKYAEIAADSENINGLISHLQSCYQNYASRLKTDTLSSDERYTLLMSQHVARRELLLYREHHVRNINLLIEEYSPSLRKLINNTQVSEARRELWLEYKAMFHNPTYKRRAVDFLFYAKEACMQGLSLTKDFFVNTIKFITNKLVGSRFKLKESITPREDIQKIRKVSFERGEEPEYKKPKKQSWWRKLFKPLINKLIDILGPTVFKPREMKEHYSSTPDIKENSTFESKGGVIAPVIFHDVYNRNGRTQEVNTQHILAEDSSKRSEHIPMGKLR